MGRKIEALWDCTYCGEKGISGLTKQCPNCGHPQDEDIKFYLPTDIERHVLDKETAKEYGKGADWVCSYCGSLNRYNAQTCRNCGADRKEQKGDYLSLKERSEEAGPGEASNRTPDCTPDRASNRTPDRASNRTPDCTPGRTPDRASEARPGFAISKTGYRRPRNDAYSRIQQRRNPHPPIEKKPASKKPLIVVAVLLAIAVLFAYMPRNATATLDHKNWSRSISIEKYQTVKESDWSVPDGGRVYDKKNEVHHYDQVLDHYEEVEVEHTREVFDGYDVSYEYIDNGDGTYDEEEVRTPRYRTETYYETEEQPVYRDEPVYKAKYYYEIERWKPDRSVDTSGDADEPYWGKVKLSDDEREGDRTESYTLSFTTGKGKTYSVDLPQEYWEKYSEGSEAKITIRHGSIIKIDGTAVKDMK